MCGGAFGVFLWCIILFGVGFFEGMKMSQKCLKNVAKMCLVGTSFFFVFIIYEFSYNSAFQLSH